MPLSQPVTALAVERSSGALGRVAVASMQGVRASHEDAHAINHSLGFAAVFDGHVGDEASEFAAARLPLHFRAQGSQSPAAGLRKAFADCEAELLQTLPEGCEAGTTATAAVVRPDGDTFRIHVANCGDSRAVLWRKVSDTVEATRDHRPDDAEEKSRIEAAGGTVCEDFDPPRIDGKLACSRALGSFAYKSGGKEPENQKVSCIPDMYEWEASAGDILLIACDGVFDTISNEQLVQMVCRRDDDADLGLAVAKTLDHCIAKECDDNMTLLAVELVVGVEPLQETEVTAGNFTKMKDSEVVEQYKAFCKRFGYELTKEMQKKGPPQAVLTAIPAVPGRYADLPEPPDVTEEKPATPAPGDEPLVLKVTMAKPVASYVKAAQQLFEGDDEKPALDRIEVQALGNAVPIAALVATELMAKGFTLVSVATDYPTMTPTRQGPSSRETQVARLKVLLSKQ